MKLEQLLFLMENFGIYGLKSCIVAKDYFEIGQHFFAINKALSYDIKYYCISNRSLANCCDGIYILNNGILVPVQFKGTNSFYPYSIHFIKQKALLYTNYNSLIEFGYCNYNAYINDKILCSYDNNFLNTLNKASFISNKDIISVKNFIDINNLSVKKVENVIFDYFKKHTISEFNKTSFNYRNYFIKNIIK